MLTTENVKVRHDIIHIGMGRLVRYALSLPVPAIVVIIGLLSYLLFCLSKKLLKLFRSDGKWKRWRRGRRKKSDYQEKFRLQC